MKKSSLIFLALLVLASSLSYDPTHRQSDEEKQNYLDSLLKIHGNMKQQYQKAKTQADSIDASLQNIGAQSSLERNILENGIEKERTIFLSMKESAILPTSLKTWDCLNLTQEQIDNKNILIAKLKEQKLELSQTIQNQGDCVKTDQLKFQVQSLDATLKRLKNDLGNTCDPPKVLLPIMYVTNLDNVASKNYILADLTEQSYEKKNQDLQDSYRVEECPKEQPYSLGGTQCGQCSKVYNVSSQECLEQGCPHGTYFNEEQNKCLVTPKLANIGAQDSWIYGNMTPEEYSSSIQKLRDASFTETCTQEKPYPNADQECIACQEGQVYDLSLSQCVNCPEGEVLDEDNHVCKKQALNGGVASNQENGCTEDLPLWNGTACIKCESPGTFEDNVCHCPENYTYQWDTYKCEQKKLCEEQNFFWNGSICIKCEDPGKFNKDTSKCECPENQTYNEKNQVCVFGNGVIAYVPNLVESKNWIYGDGGKQEYDENLSKINSQVTTQECPLDAPYPDENGKCVVCGEGQLYDLTTKKCTTCLQGQQLNEETHSCENIKSEGQKCQDPLPYWNGTNCIKCEDPGTFTNQTCICPQNYRYNWDKLVCEAFETKHITNFAANEWVYGELNSQSYNQKIQSLSKQYKLEKCPADLPFVSNSGDCIDCPEGKTYDLSTGFCTECAKINEDDHICEALDSNPVVCPDVMPYYNGTGCIRCESPGNFNKEKKICECPETYFFNLDDQTCEIIPTNIKNSNNQAVNYAGTLPEFNQNLQTCPEETPFFNGNECVACESPNYFNFDKKDCEVCEEKFVFDISSKKCILKEIPVVKFNSLVGGDENAKNYCCEVPAFDSMINTCPEDKPFFNNKQCIQCGYPYYFNFTNVECQICDEGKKFSQVSKVCVENKFLEVVYRSTLNENITNFVGQPQEIDSLYENIQSCPKENPFYDSDQCLSCALPSYFNFNTKKCESCPSDQQFNLTEKKCEIKELLTDKYNNYLVEAENFAGDIPFYDSKYKTCPSITPFYDGENCIECKTPSFFDMTNQECKECPESQFFNLVTRQCELSTQKYITNIKRDNIYYNGNFDKIVKFTSDKMKADKSIQYCPDDKPFYQAVVGQCISCPDENPYFDVKYSKCKQCEGDSYFDASKHVCVSNGVVQPTVERMIMNIFSFL